MIDNSINTAKNSQKMEAYLYKINKFKYQINNIQ